MIDSESIGLIDGYCEGTLSEDEAAAVLEKLRAGGEFREAFVESLYVHGQLRATRAMPSAAEGVRRALGSGESTTVANVLLEVQKVAAGRRRSRRVLRLLAAVAACALAFFGWQLANRSVPPAAVVAEVDDAAWASGEAIVAGKELAAGDYSLGRGSLALHRPRQYLLRISGASRFTVAADGAVRLLQGRVSVSVEPGGNIVLQVPGATLTDLGTSFWVAVDGNGDSRLQVLSGRVQLAPDHGGTPVAVDAGGSVMFAADTGAVTHLPAVPAPGLESGAYSNWRTFTEFIHTDPSLLAHYGFANYTFASTAANLARSEYGLTNTGTSPPLPGPGRWGPASALHCYGEEYLWHSEQMPSLAAFTIGCWVKFDNLNEPHGLIRRWRNHQEADYVLRFGGEGKLEFFTKTLENGYVGGPFNTAVVADRWTLIMATYDGTRMRLYVDGEASPTTYEQHGHTFGAADKFMLCRDHRDVNLRGLMDEVFVYGRALSAAEIDRHYLAGRLPE